VIRLFVEEVLAGLRRRNTRGRAPPTAAAPSRKDRELPPSALGNVRDLPALVARPRGGPRRDTAAFPRTSRPPVRPARGPCADRADPVARRGRDRSRTRDHLAGADAAYSRRG